MKNEELHKENVAHITSLIHAIQDAEPDNGAAAVVMTGLNTLILMRICAKLGISLTDIDINLKGGLDEGEEELAELINGMPKNLGGIS